MRNERGIALVFVLFLLTTVSALAVSLTFLANSETYASGNYRLATQARYAAESGAQKAADFLLDPTQYVPGTAAETIAGIDTSKSPVEFNGKPVILSASATQASNYPDVTTQNKFNAAAKGFLTAGSTQISFGAYAKLLREETFSDAYTAAVTTVQTWEITADGLIQGVHPATVEITTQIETLKVPAFQYAAFAANPNCDALEFDGSTTTNSYNTPPIGTSPSMLGHGGDVGTNGNMTLKGGAVQVNGNLSTPREGVGNCVNGNNGSGITALQGAETDIKGGSIVRLPKPITLPTPAPAAVSPQGGIKNSDIKSTICSSLGLVEGTNCHYTSGGGSVADTVQIWNTSGTPLSLPEVSLTSKTTFILTASNVSGVSNEYDFNSLALTGQASIAVSTPSPSDRVIVRVGGTDNTGSPVTNAISFDGGSVSAPLCASCSPFDASLMQFVYAGSGNITFAGNPASSATFYAPNAAATLNGDDNFYGALVSNTIKVTGNANIFYDQQLAGTGWTHGVPMMTAFSWKNANN